MPNTTSAEKQVRVSEKRRLRNKSYRSLCKTSVITAEKLIFSGQTDEAQKAVVTAVSVLDKASEKGIIHPNNAARRNSRLMKKLNQSQAAPAPPAAPAE